MMKTPFNPGGTVQPTAEVMYVVSEKVDYNNALKVTLRFKRYNSELLFPDLHDGVIFSDGDSAQEVIKRLRGLSDRLEESCVLKVAAGHQCPHCQEIFYNYTRRRKIYCKPLCQNTAGVKRLRAKKKEKPNE